MLIATWLAALPIRLTRGLFSRRCALRKRRVRRNDRRLGSSVIVGRACDNLEDRTLLSLIATDTTVTATALTTPYGSSETLTATVAGVPSGTPNAGTVQFYDNGTALGTAQTVSGGVATLRNVTTLPVGADVISAVYAGDGANFLGSSTSRVGPNSIITTVAGNGTHGFTGDAGPATAAELSFPAGVAVDASGNLFIADFINNRIREVNYSTGVITTVAGLDRTATLATTVRQRRHI